MLIFMIKKKHVENDDYDVENEDKIYKIAIIIYIIYWDIFYY